MAKVQLEKLSEKYLERRINGKFVGLPWTGHSAIAPFSNSQSRSLRPIRTFRTVSENTFSETNFRHTEFSETKGAIRRSYAPSARRQPVARRRPAPGVRRRRSSVATCERRIWRARRWTNRRP